MKPKQSEWEMEFNISFNTVDGLTDEQLAEMRRDLAEKIRADLEKQFFLGKRVEAKDDVVDVEVLVKRVRSG